MGGKEFEISKYAPSEIKQLYKMLNNDSYMKTAYIKQVEILEKLISKKHDNKPVEKDKLTTPYGKMWDIFRSKSFYIFDYFELIRCIEKATNYPQSMKRTGKGKKDQLKDIIKQSKNLAKLVKNDHWLRCTSCFDCFPDYIRQDIKLRLVNNLNLNKPAFSLYQRLIAPTIENILDGIIERAKQEIKTPVLVAQANTTESKNIYFVKIMASFMRDKLGKLNAPIIKTLASMHLDTELSINFINNHTCRKENGKI